MKYVAFLRGINVGGNKKVEMSKLKICFENLGYESIVTYINSGNVLFVTKRTNIGNLSREIEKALKKKFGFEIPVVVRSKKSIVNLEKNIPSDWKNDHIQKTDVLFLWNQFDNKRTISCLPITPHIDRLMYVRGAVIWNLKKENYTKSGIHKLIGTVVYRHMTIRNVNTVRKLASLM